MNKTYQAWKKAQDYCLAHPGKSTTIKMVDGTFTLTWTPKKAEKIVDENSPISDILDAYKEGR